MSDAELDVEDDEALDSEAEAVDETELLVSNSVVWVALTVIGAESVEAGVELILMTTGATSVGPASDEVVVMGVPE